MLALWVAVVSPVHTVDLQGHDSAQVRYLRTALLSLPEAVLSVPAVDSSVALEIACRHGTARGAAAGEKARNVRSILPHQKDRLERFAQQAVQGRPIPSCQRKSGRLGRFALLLPPSLVIPQLFQPPANHGVRTIKFK